MEKMPTIIIIAVLGTLAAIIIAQNLNLCAH